MQGKNVVTYIYIYGLTGTTHSILKIILGRDNRIVLFKEGRVKLQTKPPFTFGILLPNRISEG